MSQFSNRTGRFSIEFVIGSFVCVSGDERRLEFVDRGDVAVVVSFVGWSVGVCRSSVVIDRWSFVVRRFLAIDTPRRNLSRDRQFIEQRRLVYKHAVFDLV